MAERAIILAAGRGSRMGGLTQWRPKCLSVIAGRPLIEWQVGALQRAGISEIAVVTGYMAESLRDPRYKIFHNARWADTNMVMSLACASPWLEKSACVVSYSDIVYHYSIVQQLVKSDAPLAITYDRQWRDLWTARFADPLSDAETFRVASDGKLLEIGAKAASLDDIQGQYMGLLKFTPAGWKQVARLLDGLMPGRRDKMDMTSLLSLMLKQGIVLQTVPVDGRWCEVDNADDLALYEQRLQTSWTHDWR